MDFPGPTQRLSRVVLEALDGCSYVSTRRPEQEVLVVEARRPDGRRVEVHFRGVTEWDATGEPTEGAILSFDGATSAEGFRILGLLLPPIFRKPAPPAARVRIKAGSQRLEVVCQDAEWYEDRS
jgi:hypothetical protein